MGITYYSVYKNSTGNVGIGTTSPASKLSIAGSSATNFKSLILRNGDGTIGSTVSIDLETSAGTIGDEAALAARISGIRLGSGTAGGLVFATTDGGNLGERVRILNNGAVGIGTTSPSLISGYVGLNVVNAGYTQIKLQSSASSAGIEFKPSSGNSWELQANNSNQWFVYDRTQSVYRLIIDVNGNVGIGATPIAPLDVQCNTGGTGIILRGRTDNSTALRFYANNGTTQQLYIGTDDSNIDFLSVANRPIRFFVNSLIQYQINQLGVFSWYDGAGGTRMTLNSTGLGIGTTSPNTPLDVVSTSGANALQIRNRSNNDYGFIIFNNYAGSETSIAQIGAYRTGVNQGSLLIYTGTTEKVRINNDGNVGIGTSSPAQKLHVVGAVYGTTSGQFGTAVANGANANFAVFGGNSTSVGVKLVLDSDVNRNDLVVTATSGNIGIGTSNAAYKLDVFSSIVSRSNISTPRFSSAGGYVYGVTNSPTWTTYLGSYTNNNATAPDGTTSAGTYTFTATAGGYDLYQAISSLTVGRVYTIGMWVKLGTATNFCLVVNNTQSWNTIGGNAFTSSDGLSTGKWTHISYTFTAIAPGNINLHLGSHAETAVTQQTAGTVFLWNIEMTEFSSTWIGNVEDEIRLPGSSIWTSRGKIGIGTTAPVAKLHIGSDVEPNISNQTLFVQGSKTGYAGFAGLPMGSLMVYDDTASTAGSGGAISFGANTGSSQRTWIAAIESRRDSAVNDGTNYGGSLVFYTRPAQSPSAERMRITSSGSLLIGDTTQAYGPTTFGYMFGVKSQVSQSFISIAKSGQTLDSGGIVLGLDATSAYLWARENIPILFGTNNNEKVKIAADGNVGIGTSSPTGTYGKLSVAGGIRILDDNNAKLEIGRYSSGASNSYIKLGSNSNSLRITNNTDTAEIFTIENGGNVGIGTTSPLNKLSVISSNTFSYYNKTDPIATFQGVSPATVLISVDGNTDGYYAELKLGNAQSTYYSYSAYIRGIQGAGIDNYKMEFGTANGSVAATRMTIATNGNVGIGTTSPSWLLTAYAASLSQFALSNATRNFVLTNNAGDGLLSFNYASVNRLQFDTTNQWFNTGNVGIGTTTAFSKTTISKAGVSLPTTADSTNNAHLTLAGSNSLVRLQFGTQNVAPFGGWIQASYDNTAGDNGAEPILLNPLGGNVGIGATTPAYKLDVSGTGRFTGDLTLSGALNGAALNGTTGFFSSDLSIVGQHQIRNANPTITFRDTNNRTAYIHVNADIFYVLTAVADSAYGSWGIVANSRWPLEINLSTNNAVFGGDVNAISFTGSGSGLTGTAASLSIGGAAGSISGFNNPTTAATASTIVYRDSGGDISTRYFLGSYVNSTDDTSSTGITYIMAKFGNDYHRSASAAKVATFISGQTMDINGSSTSCSGTATTATTANALNTSNSYTVTQLDIAATTPSLYVRNTGTSPSAIRLLAYLGATYIQSGTSTASTSADLVFSSMGALSEWIRILGSNGNVGIGTASPAYKLDVNGNIHATAFPTSSDIRFKKNITPLENSLEKIKKLQGVKYEWNEFVNSKRDGYKLNVPIIGLIAQDVEKIVPEVVDLWELSEDCKDARSIDYPRLTPLLIEAIKEQQIIIENQNQKIENLIARMSALEAK